jgi:RHS repeat-associated protein
MGAPRRRLSCSTYNSPVIFRRGGLWRALGAAIVVLAGVLSPARAVASLPSYSDAHADELAAIAPLPELSLPEAPPAPDAFDVRPKTRVRGFEVGLHCSIGGDEGLTCGSRRAYRAPYDGNASDISVFTGYVYSPLLNLYYAKARFYDPETARFTSQDDWQYTKADQPPTLDLYLYANDNPTRYTDPEGHEPQEASSDSGLQYGMGKRELERLAKSDERPWDKPASEEARQSDAPVVAQEEQGVWGGTKAWIAGKWNQLWNTREAAKKGAGVLARGVMGDRFATGPRTAAEEAQADARDKAAIALEDVPGGKHIVYHTQETFSGTIETSKDIAQKGGEGAYEIAEQEAGIRTVGMGVGALRGEGGALLRTEERTLATEERAFVAEERAAAREVEAGTAAARAERATGSTATQVGTRRLPNRDNPWIKYQKHVTARPYEEMWELNAKKVGVDASSAGYTVEAKWTGQNNAAWRQSPYNPRSEFYNEQKILDQARNLIDLNKASGGNGVRYAVSNPAARQHFETLFRQHFPGENIQVWHVPGTGMK